MKNLWQCLNIILWFALTSCEYTSNPVANNDQSKNQGTGYQGQSNGENNGGTISQINITNFENDIKPLLVQSCMPCHGNGNPKNWQSYNSTKMYALDILASVKHEPGYKAMPMGKSKLKDTQIQLIKDWIDSGMKEKNDVIVNPSTTTATVELPEGPTKSDGETISHTSQETSISPAINLNPSASESFYLTNCASCHDNQEFYPNLKGQNKQYLIDQMNDFKSGSRVDPSMNYFAQTLLVDEAMIEDIAGYLTQKKIDCVVRKKIIINDLGPNETVDSFKGKDLATTCLGCHTNDNSMFPILNGQNPNYLIKTLTDLKTQDRPSNTMKFMLDAIERQDMINLSAFFHENSECEQ